MASQPDHITTTEKATIDMLNIMRKKEIYGLIFSGTTTTGYYTQNVSPPIIMNEVATHRIYLQSFSGWENINNVNTGVNDLFRYVNNSGTVRDIIIPAGAYQLTDLYSYIQAQMQANGDYNSSTSTPTYYINFNTFVPTQQIQITLSNNYQVDFRPSTSISSILGFDNILLNGNSTFSSTKTVNILSTLSININCNIANGFRVNGNQSNVLYSFNNTTPRGSIIDISPNPIVPCICNTKTISSVTIWFNDESGNLINFKGEKFVVRIVIEQM
jgi:5'(3')-deoxyribonucleotidase